ncbi:MAG: arylsulfotransferase family protein, partial [Paracoccaceae bacterium]
MDKLLFKRIDLWLVVLIVVMLLLSMLAFGAIVRDRAFGHNRFGAIGEISFQIASLPAEAGRELQRLMSDDVAGMSTLHSEEFEGRSGWEFSDSRLDSGLDGYLLFSRHDGDAGHHVFELVDLKSGTVEHRIDLDASVLFSQVEHISRFGNPEDWQSHRFQAVHPLPLENGDLLVKGNSPMVRMSPCGEPIWTIDQSIFHHTIEPGLDGEFWTSSYMEEHRIDGLPNRFVDPGITKFSGDGEVLFDRSLAEVMIKADLAPLFLSYQLPMNDPLHLNDVEPVLEDGPYWKRGDVFLSIRHLSVIMLY